MALKASNLAPSCRLETNLYNRELFEWFIAWKLPRFQNVADYKALFHSFSLKEHLKGKWCSFYAKRPFSLPCNFSTVGRAVLCPSLVPAGYCNRTDWSPRIIVHQATSKISHQIAWTISFAGLLPFSTFQRSCTEWSLMFHGRRVGLCLFL